MSGQIIQGNVLDSASWDSIPDQHVQTCVTSPPYWGLRDYGVDGQLGLEKTPEEFVARMVQVFGYVRRILRDDGTVWLNLGDSYASGKGTCYNPGGGATSLGKQKKDEGAHPLDRGNKSTLAQSGLKPKDLCGIPWRVALALQADGWYLRQDIIWHKPNPMPESVRDRCTKAHEYLFLLTKKPRYYCDMEAIKEPASETSGWAKQRAKGENTWKYNDTDERKAQTGQSIESSTLGTVGTRNKRSVWTVATKPYKEAHFATFPPELIKPCVLAGCPEGCIVFDPFMGSGTTGMVARMHGRDYLGMELNPEYIELAVKRIKTVDKPLFT